MSIPKISIITPVFNGEATINQCVESVEQQNYNNKEHIFMDGMSTDNTLAILKVNEKKCGHIKVFSNKDKGIYDAMNLGLQYASGEWIYFLGCDDVLADNFVLSDLFGNKSTEAVDIIYGGVEMNRSKKLFFYKFDKERLSWMNMSHQGLFVKNRVFKKIGGFNLKYNALADYDFNLRWFGKDEYKRIFTARKVAIYNEEGFSSEFYDKVFYDEKLMLIKKYLGLNEKDAAFQDTIFRTAKIQIRNNDIGKGFRNIIKVFLLRKKLYYLKIGIIEIMKRLAVNLKFKPKRRTVK